MTNRAYDKIAAGLRDSIAHAESDEARCRVAKVDVRAARKEAGLSQTMPAYPSDPG